jgi:hypothetical protein
MVKRVATCAPNSTRERSVNATRFRRESDTACVPGPTTAPLSESPNLPMTAGLPSIPQTAQGSAKAAGLIH